MPSEPVRRYFAAIDHELLDSAAYRSLTPTAAVMLIDFIREWQSETRGGQKEIASIQFSNGNPDLSKHSMNLETWNLRRGELCAKGFIKVVSSARATYAPSDDWKHYVLADEKRDHQQPAETASLREIQQPASGKSSTTGDSRLREIQQPASGKSSSEPLENPATTKTILTTTPTYLPHGGPADSPAAPRIVTLKRRPSDARARKVQVWPPPTSARESAWAYAAWVHEAQGFWTEREALQAAEQAQRVWNAGPELARVTPGKCVEKLHETGDEGAFVASIAQLLGDMSPRGINRVRRVYNQHGPDAVACAASELLRDNVSREKRMQWLEHRAKVVGETACA